MKRFLIFLILIPGLLLANNLTVFAQSEGYPSDVTNVRATAGDKSVTLKWNAATDDDGEIAGYVIYYGTESVGEDYGEYGENIETGKVTSYQVTGLHNGTIYYFALTALDNDGNESEYYSEEVSATPKAEAAEGDEEDEEDITPPADVLNVRAVAGDSKVVLTWKKATDEGGKIVGYVIYYDTKPVDEDYGVYDKQTEVGNVLTYTVTGLDNGKTYYFAVTALDDSGNESVNYSIETSAKPKAQATDIVPPSEVENVNAVAGNAKITVSWSAATDSGSGVARYKIYYGTESVQAAGQVYNKGIINTGKITTFNLEGLQNGTTYYLAVTAVDGAGNESVNYSDEVSAEPNGEVAPAEENTGSSTPQTAETETLPQTGGSAGIILIGSFLAGFVLHKRKK